MNELKCKNQDKIILLIITATSFVLCSGFLQMHYSSDTYCLIKWGYFDYPTHYFLLDGRIVSTIICYLAGFLKIPYNVYIIGMDAIGIILLSLSCNILYKTLLGLTKIEKTINKIMLLLATYIIVFNGFSLEFLLFPESAVMCLGVFTSIFAATKMVPEDKYKYLKITILILISTFCYQGLINIFLTLSILLIILKQQYEGKNLKENLYKGVKEVLIIGIILLVAVIINIVIIKIGMVKIGDDSKRVIEFSKEGMLERRLKEISMYLDAIWNNSMNMLPKHLNSFVVVLTIGMIIKYKKDRKWELILKYGMLLLCIFAICIVPMFIFNTGICGRVNVPIAEVWGISLILILTLVDENVKGNIKYKFKEKNIYCIIILSFILNSSMLLSCISEHIAANRVDEALGKTIKYALEKYEKESGNIVTKFAYTFDENPQQYSENIKQIGSLTERKFACPWCIQEALEFYTNREFELTKMSLNIYMSYNKRDYEGFSEEQLHFYKDGLYIFIY